MVIILYKISAGYLDGGGICPQLGTFCLCDFDMISQSYKPLWAFCQA